MNFFVLLENHGNTEGGISLCQEMFSGIKSVFFFEFGVNMELR